MRVFQQAAKVQVGCVAMLRRALRFPFSALGVVSCLFPIAAQEREAPPSPAKERALGTSLALETEQRHPMLRDPDVTGYVQRVGRAVAKPAGVAWPLSVRVIEDKEARALVFPGGFLFLTTGLIARCETEAEFAGVLAHLTAHLALRHEWHTLSKESGTSQKDLIRVYFFGSAKTSCLRLAGPEEFPSGMIVRLRATEKKADIAAMSYVRAAGYDPLALLEFFNKLRHDEPRLAGHLSAEELISMRTQVESSLPPNPDFVVNTETFGALRTRLIAESKLADAGPPTLGKKTP
jgi:predicted Zn-dependent protease